MPNEPVIERIADRAARTLASVKPANGYWTDVQKVYRTFRMPEQALALPYLCVITASADGTVGEPIAHYKNRATLEVYVFLSADMAADENADRDLNRAVADVQRAILSDSPLQGGAAGAGAVVIVDELLFVRWRRAPFGDGPSWINGAVVEFAPEYLHHYTDPRLGRGES